MGRMLLLPFSQLTFFRILFPQSTALLTFLKCHHCVPNVLQMKLLRCSVALAVREPVLLKEPRPRPASPSLFSPLYTPLPKKCCSKAMASRANQGKGQRIHQPTPQQVRETLNTLSNHSLAFVLLFSPSKRWDLAVVFLLFSLNVTVTLPSYIL